MERSSFRFEPRKFRWWISPQIRIEERASVTPALCALTCASLLGIRSSKLTNYKEKLTILVNSNSSAKSIL